jgi:hypothetical protein
MISVENLVELFTTSLHICHMQYISEPFCYFQDESKLIVKGIGVTATPELVELGRAMITEDD